MNHVGSSDCGNDGISTKNQEAIHISYIKALCASANIAYSQIEHDDDSTDAIVRKILQMPNGEPFNSSIRMQLKCTYSTNKYSDHGEYITYELNAKNYRDLRMKSTAPIILGLLILPEDKSEWVKWSLEDLTIKGCMYWADLSKFPDSDNKGSVTVKLDKKNVINQKTLLDLLEKYAMEVLL